MGLWGRSTPSEASSAQGTSSAASGAARTADIPEAAATRSDVDDAGTFTSRMFGRSTAFKLSEADTARGSGRPELGGSVIYDGSFTSIVSGAVNFFIDEYRRPSHGSIRIRSGGDLHQRPPEWMEYKNVAIDGTLLTEEEKQQNANSWEKRYKRELDIAEAIQEVRKQRRMEAEHDVIGFVAQFRRFMGWSTPLDESYVKASVEGRYKLQEEADRLREEARAHEASHGTPGVMKTVVDSDTGKVRRAREDDADEAGRATTSMPPTTAAWRALMTTAETGRPLATVASEYKPRVDFYSLDPFLDSAPSVVWFSTKVGLFIGLVQGTARAVQAINVDVQFLKTSGVGVLSILNMSVFASVVKWGGNTAIFAIAFCFGDRLATMIKRRTRPAHEATQRSVVNYVAGLSMAGATVGVLPWWVLSDVPLALRLAASGAVVGGVLGLGVGIALSRLVSINVGRLDATPRQLRRYEAVMLRQRQWAQDQLSAQRSQAYVWW